VGHSPAHVENADLVIYSSAVPRENPELRAAIDRGARVVSRGRALAWLQEEADTVAVSGSHGKTTTTWITANLLLRCGLDPTVVVGGQVSELNGNVRIGRSRLFVTEADESDGSFLHLRPQYGVVTNIDADHLDHWASIGELEAAFRRFADGCDTVIACRDCPRARLLCGRAGGGVLSYGVGGGDVFAENVALRPGYATYDLCFPGGAHRGVRLSLPGMHNVRNSLAGLAVAWKLGLPMSDAAASLAETSGVGRRLEKRGARSGVTVYDDYAHHPAEISATLEAVRDMAGGRLIGVFQPHRYSRTKQLSEAFGSVFDRLDRLIITPVYAASERPIEGVDSRLIAREVSRRGAVAHDLVADLESAIGRLESEVRPGDTVITLGAGDVWKVGDALLGRIGRIDDPAEADAA
jgi:UDP-N-acetylmuramate--alanine ligase